MLQRYLVSLILALAFAQVQANTGLVKLGLDACRVNGFCNGNTPKRLNNTGCCKPCSCDSSCVYSRNCCPDANLNMSTWLDPYHPFSTCENAYVKFSDGVDLHHMRPFFSVVSMCPDGWLCKPEQPSTSNFNLSTFVFVSDRQRGIIFTNRQCAFCHGVTDLVDWTVESDRCFDFSSKIIEELASGESSILFQACQMIMLPPRNFRIISERFQCGPYESDCTYSSKYPGVDVTDVEKACASGIFEIFNMERIKNPYCFYCVVPEDNIETYLIDYCHPEDNSKTLFSDNNLFRLLDTGIEEQDASKCGATQALDIVQDTCRPLHCPLFSKPRNGNCEPAAIRVLFQYRFYVFLKFMYVSSANQGNKMSHPDDTLAEALLQRSMLLTNTKTECLLCAKVIPYVHAQTSETGFYVAMEIIKKYTEGFCTPTHGNFKFLSLSNLNVDISSTRFNVRIIDIPIMLNDSLYFDEYGAFHWRIEKVESVHLGGILLTKVNDSFKYFDLSVMNVHTLYMHPCPFFKMNLSEICGLMFDDACNVSNKFPETPFHEIWKLTETGMLFTEYRICVQDYNALFTSLNATFLTSDRMVVIIVSSISLVCVVLFSIVKMGHVESSTRPFFFPMIINVLIAQATYLLCSVWVHDLIFCTVCGMINHFTWLSTAFSINGLCCMVQRKLHFTKCSFSINKSLILFFAYTYVTPAILVVGNIIYSLVTSDRAYVGYGHTSNFCNITKPLVRALLYTLPIFLTVLGNIGALIKIVQSLQVTPSKAMTTCQSDYQNAVACFWMSMLLALTWFIDFINGQFESDALEIGFVVLVSSQGIGFCLAFVCKLKCNGSFIVSRNFKGGAFRSS